MSELTLAESGDASRILGVSATAVRQYEESGVLPAAAKTLRGCRLFRLEDIERLRIARAARKATRRPTSSTTT
jgi:DNA-binding transcriptional MerR regulator